jgi:hypothetical protein
LAIPTYLVFLVKEGCILLGSTLVFPPIVPNCKQRSSNMGVFICIWLTWLLLNEAYTSSYKFKTQRLLHSNSILCCIQPKALTSNVPLKCCVL